jgi:hypothetical protein
LPILRRRYFSIEPFSLWEKVSVGRMREKPSLAPSKFKVSIEFEAEFASQKSADRRSLTRPSGTLSQRERGNPR